MTQPKVRRTGHYKLNEWGVFLLSRFVDPDYRVFITDVQAGDRVTISASLTEIPGATVHVDLPAEMFELAPERPTPTVDVDDFRHPDGG